MMVYEHTSYRSLIKEVLAERTSRNPSYSLRAMAGQLGFAHSTLSEVMKGSANLSRASARKLASRLGLGQTETEYFCLLVELDQPADPEHREYLLARIKSLNPRKI